MKRQFKSFVAKVEMLKSERANEDKNGLMPVILIGIAGEIPSKTVISGTVAQRMGIYEGSIYLFQANEIESDPLYGRQFNFMAISKELSAIETLQASDFVGKLRIVKVDSSEDFEEFVADTLQLENA
ncbi:hypothetical protein C1637_02260 [Chryseobacterium lactis]|uniref:Uncharacterized protein n=1 Tax=Chryseobacterium lactis TaxID=1241981 RepID=A0A3G6RQ30_CHRLC|nr:hypothetical protein [Chryseobacterium lactis]AZA81419.1 hypothetical protein EG342_05645 [Chryseobacterium lactis]AZB06418.1 hypothetical protein EG341_21770 [Chryseobacterium lactis]PNW15270.1 hypothetical protein C1637_02260 [Chryseobacterium lactis]